MATSYDCHIANGDYFSIPCSAKRSPHIATSATSATYWDNTLYSEFSLPSSDSTMPSPTSPNSVSFPPRHYSLPDLYHGQRKPDDALGPHPYESFMQWEVTPDNTMDPSLSHFFPELKLENTFSPAMGGLKNQPNPMPMGIPVTDNMMSETIHDPASVFGEDPITEGPLFDTPTVNTPPLNEVQPRSAFYNVPTQQPSCVPRVAGPVTRGSAAAMKTGNSTSQESKLRNVAPTPKSYAPVSPSSASSASPPPVSARSSRRKRKSSESDDEDDESPAETRSYQSRNHAPVKKTAHNMIEKRYRTNLNDKIAALRDCVPSLRVTNGTAVSNGVKKAKGDAPEDLQGLTPAHKLNKATVLSKAAEYIMHLEKRNKALCKENAAYKGRIEAFEILMLTTKNSNTTTTTTAANAPRMSVTSSTRSESENSRTDSFDSVTSATSLSESGLNENGDVADGETKMQMSEEEEVLKNELDAATATN